MTVLHQDQHEAQDAQSASEFRELYRRPGTRYLGLAFLMGGVSSLGFYGLDIAGGALSWYGGAQTWRLFFAALCFSLTVLTRSRAELVTRWYSLIFATFVLVCLLIAALTSYGRHADDSLTQLTRGL